MNVEATLEKLLFWQRDKDAHRTARVAASALASLARGFCGSRVGKLGPRPEKRLVLYEIENCPFSRKVREALSILDLDVDILPCPRGETRHRRDVERIGGRLEVPMLLDPNTAEVLYDAHAIVDYLFKNYGTHRADLRLRLPVLSDRSSQLASALRGGAGTSYEPGRYPELPLELWTYEACAEGRLVRETLSTYAIPYVLHNSARGSHKRAELAERFGVRDHSLHVPFLHDPNRNVNSIGAGNAMAHIKETYGSALERHMPLPDAVPSPQMA